MEEDRAGNLGKRVESASAASSQSLEIPLSFISLLQISAIDKSKAASLRRASLSWMEVEGALDEDSSFGITFCDNPKAILIRGFTMVFDLG
jgi:hypothetical protein